MAGKGGVGKTTVGASLAIAAARSGSDVLLIELEGHSTLSPLLGDVALGYDDVTIELSEPCQGRLRARSLKPDDALTDYLDRAGLGPISGRLSRSGAMEVVVTAAPGIRDLLTLGKIRQLEQASDAELIIVDAPAAGHALTFLTAPAGLAASTTSGPVREQADLVLEMFADDARCQVMLVTLPEETPVSETIETAFSLEEDVGIKLSPVVVNAVWPQIEGLAASVDEMSKLAGKSGNSQLDPAIEAATYRLARIEDQQAEMARLSEELPLDQIHLPFLFRTELALPEVEQLADSLGEQIEQMASAEPTGA